MIINMFGGPGTGKSTLAARIFSEMKCDGINCELVTEYAKDLVWRQMQNVMKDEIYIFAKQQHRIRMVSEHVDHIITDSPLLLPLIYDKDPSDEFIALILHEYNKYDSLNLFLNRFKPYCEVGRNETEEEARAIDDVIKDMLYDYDIDYYTISHPDELHWEDIKDLVL